MRSLPRMSLTSSVIGACLLAQQRIDQCLAACCRACLENIPDRFLVEPDQGDHDLLVTGVSIYKMWAKMVGRPPPMIKQTSQKRASVIWNRRLL
jgi:hypothetical protein